MAGGHNRIESIGEEFYLPPGLSPGVTRTGAGLPACRHSSLIHLGCFVTALFIEKAARCFLISIWLQAVAMVGSSIGDLRPKKRSNFTTP